MFDQLYNTDILSLAAGLKTERLENPDGAARKVSKLCGSWLEIDLNVQNDVIAECSLRVQACALGQASAGILQENIIGANYDEILTARNALYAMLKFGHTPPSGRFEKIKLLAGVQDYPARHTSTMLAFDAALAALEMALPRA